MPFGHASTRRILLCTSAVKLFLKACWEKFGVLRASGYALDGALGFRSRLGLGRGSRDWSKDLARRLALRGQPVLERGGCTTAVFRLRRHRVTEVAALLRKLLPPAAAGGEQTAQGPRQVFRLLHLKDRQHPP